MTASPADRDDRSAARAGPSPAPAPDGSTDDDPFLAHVERVMAPGPAIAAPRPRPADRVSPLPTPTPDAEETRADHRHLLQCQHCGWAVECLAPDVDRFVRAGCLLCGAPVAPGPAGASPPAEAVQLAPGPRNQRRTPRRRARGGARVEVRKAGPCLGRDLALALADVSTEGLGVWLSAQVRPGEEMDVLLVPAGNGRPVQVRAEVRWCAPGGDWTYRAGLHLRRSLPAPDLADLSL